jgi:DNA-binding SARP family transcriptional activator/tetratricopeptide (TPR) repeat protein
MAVHDQHGRTFLPRSRKTRALLAVLALASPKPVLRLQLASLLWSQREKQQARASLRQSVHELQDTLGYTFGHLLSADRHNLALSGALTVDAASLTQPAPDAPDILDQLKEALLEDLNGLDPAFDRWLGEERARFVRIGRTIGEGLLARRLDPDSTVETAEQLLVIDRSHEGAWRAIMRAHAERGDRSAAMATYERCRSALADVAQTPPSLETEDLIQRIRDDFTAGRRQGSSIPTSLQATQTGIRRDRPPVRLCIAPLRSIGETVDDGIASGLAEEISAGMARFRWISCVPATFWQGTPNGSATEATWAGVEADLVLEGTIQRADRRVRVIVRLIDMRAAGEIVWAGRFDRDMADPLALQDEVGAAIVAQVDPELMRHEGRRSVGRKSSDLTAQDLLLQALPALYRMERTAFLASGRMLEASLRADPVSSVAHGWLAYWNLLYVGQGWAPDPARSTADAASLAERAILLDSSDARALTLAGHVRGFLGRHPEEAIGLHERAIALNPNLALAWCFSGLSHSYLGRHDEALRRIRQALRLSPSDPHVFFFDMALIMPHLMGGDYAKAIDVGRRAIELNPWFSSAYKGYLAALGHMNRRQDAAEVLRRLLDLEPGFSVEQAMLRSPLVLSEDIARYADGLRRAGLPETGTAAPRRAPTPSVDHPAIDLASAAPHSPRAWRDDPRSNGEFGNETTW